MVDYELSKDRTSAIDSAWTLLEQLHLTDRGEWRSAAKTQAYQRLGLELHEFIRYHSATEIRQVWRLLGYALTRVNERLQPLTPDALSIQGHELETGLADI